MTYARARLWTGVVGVGTVVTAAVLLLWFRVPSRIFDDLGGGATTEAALLFAVLSVSALAALPFDILGGFVLPRRFRGAAPSAGVFALRWLRGVLVLIGVSTLSGTLLIQAGRLGGRPAAITAFVLIALAMISLQEPLARLVGGLRRAAPSQDESGVLLLSGSDSGFSGGFAGFSAKLVLPERWSQRFDPNTLALLIERRRAILRSGAWRRGLALAMLWNTSGFLLASWLPGAGVRSVAELITTALGFTLWSFLGLLILPTPSRRATLSADSEIGRDLDSRKLLSEAVKSLDGLQDDEPDRSKGLESIFHPVPSVSNRLRALAESGLRKPGAWHLARTALYLSYGGVSLLPRAVHCNVGRPELWVYLPTDG